MNNLYGLNVVLLAAGRGSRIGELTTHTHKSLLPIGGHPCIKHILDGVLNTNVREVVLVTGYMNHLLNKFVVHEYDDDRIKFMHNPYFEHDTNILSVDIGVDALSHPENGYLLVETDIVIEPEGWQHIMDIDPLGPSLWLTRGSYSRMLTGGALRRNEQFNVEEIVYAPRYDPTYEGWQKLLGLLFVGKAQVRMDQNLRKAAIKESIQQYYITPWCLNIAKLACKALSLDSKFAFSFNNRDSYEAICAQYESIVKKGAVGREY